ncbi:MAG: RpiB/LacA/LacB family sugar-phosphate isomerase [Myxococcota bacterium]
MELHIVLASDHAGVHYKARIRDHLRALGHRVRDLGTGSEAPVDHPRFVRPAAEAVARGERLVPWETALAIVDAWLTTPFEGGRHLRRIRLIDE